MILILIRLFFWIGNPEKFRKTNRKNSEIRMIAKKRSQNCKTTTGSVIIVVFGFFLIT